MKTLSFMFQYHLDNYFNSGKSDVTTYHPNFKYWLFLIISLFYKRKRFRFKFYERLCNNVLYNLRRCCWRLTPAGNYMFKVTNRNTRARCEICPKLTIKIPERRQHRSGIFIINFEHISHLVLVFLLLTLSR